MSKEALIEQIEKKAKDEADNIVHSAIEAANAQKAKAEEELRSEYDKKIAAFKQEAELALDGQKTLMRIETQKAELNAKREIIDEVYKKVTDKLCSLNDEEYRDFIGSLIAKFAENGDKVIIARRDEKRLDAEWLLALKKRLDISLELSDEFHSDIGGIILRGNKYDKNLTITAIIDEIKKATESNVANRLFG